MRFRISLTRVAIYTFFGICALLLMVINTPVWHGLTAEAQASWVQAVGSILAIIGAASIAMHQTAEKNRAIEAETRRKGLAMAVLLRAAIDEWFGRVEGKIIPKPNEYGDGAAVGMAIAQIRRADPFAVSGVVMKEISRLWTMGPAGQQLLQAISRSHELDKLSATVFAAAKNAPRGDIGLTEMSSRFFRKYFLQMSDLASVKTYIAHVLDRDVDKS